MSGCLLLAMLAAVLPAAPAAPAPLPPPTAAEGDGGAPVGLLAGAAAALIPLVVGGALLAQDDSKQSQEMGAQVMAAGFALAPWVAHGVRGSGRRALLYGGISTTFAAGAIVMMHATDTFDPYIANRLRMPFSILLGCAFGSAIIGVLASELDPPPAEARPPRLSLWLLPAPGGASAGIAARLPL